MDTIFSIVKRAPYAFAVLFAILSGVCFYFMGDLEQPWKTIDAIVGIVFGFNTLVAVAMGLFWGKVLD